MIIESKKAPNVTTIYKVFSLKQYVSTKFLLNKCSQSIWCHTISHNSGSWMLVADQWIRQRQATEDMKQNCSSRKSYFLKNYGRHQSNQSIAV
jgi:hypothetical protein